MQNDLHIHNIHGIQEKELAKLKKISDLCTCESTNLAKFSVTNDSKEKFTSLDDCLHATLFSDANIHDAHILSSFKRKPKKIGHTQSR